MIIAIDGPAGSGKSTVAKRIAQRLNFRHIETGSMYRAVAWKAMRKGISLDRVDAVVDLAKNLDIEFVPGPGGQQIRVDGENISGRLKTEAVSRAAAQVAAYPGVREILTAKQRAMGEKGSVVMEGRDIGTDVFPAAEKKFFLEADPEERGRRRYMELKEKNPQADLEQIVEQVKQRDREDRNRAVAPLRPAEDAVRIDTTHLNIEEVVNKMVGLIQPPKN